MYYASLDCYVYLVLACHALVLWHVRMTTLNIAFCAYLVYYATCHGYPVAYIIYMQVYIATYAIYSMVNCMLKTDMK